MIAPSVPHPCGHQLGRSRHGHHFWCEGAVVLSGAVVLQVRNLPLADNTQYPSLANASHLNLQTFAN